MPRQDEVFRTNLMRLLSAQLEVSLSLHAAQALFGKGYPALSLAEQVAVDNWVFGAVGARFQRTTPELFPHQTEPGPLGFRGSTTSPTSAGS